MIQVSDKVCVVLGIKDLGFRQSLCGLRHCCGCEGMYQPSEASVFVPWKLIMYHFLLQTILQKGILLERDALRLMACIGQVLSILPIPDIMNYLDAILVPRLDHMQQLVKQEVSELPPAWHMGDEVLPNVMSCLGATLVRWLQHRQQLERTLACTSVPVQLSLWLPDIILSVIPVSWHQSDTVTKQRSSEELAIMLPQDTWHHTYLDTSFLTSSWHWQNKDLQRK